MPRAFVHDCSDDANQRERIAFLQKEVEEPRPPEADLEGNFLEEENEDSQEVPGPCARARDESASRVPWPTGPNSLRIIRLTSGGDL